MATVGLNDIVWSKEEFYPSDIPSQLGLEYPLLCIVSRGGNLDADCDTLWPKNQVLCINGVVREWVVVNSVLLGKVILPTTIPIKFCTRNDQTESGYSRPKSLLECITEEGLPRHIRFDDNVLVFHEDTELEEDLDVRYVTNSHEEPCFACITINGCSAEDNIFLTWPCDNTFKIRIAIGFIYGFSHRSDRDWANFTKHLATNPGQFYVPTYLDDKSVQMPKKLLKFTSKYITEHLVLNQNIHELDEHLLESLGLTHETDIRPQNVRHSEASGDNGACKNCGYGPGYGCHNTCPRCNNEASDDSDYEMPRSATLSKPRILPRIKSYVQPGVTCLQLSSRRHNTCPVVHIQRRGKSETPPVLTSIKAPPDGTTIHPSPTRPPRRPPRLCDSTKDVDKPQQRLPVKSQVPTSYVKNDIPMPLPRDRKLSSNTSK